VAAETAVRALVVVITVASVVIALVSTVLGVLNLDTPTPGWMSMGSKVVEVSFPLAALTLIGTGALVAMRHPRHLVGWSYLLSGLGSEILLMLRAYGLYGTTTDPGAPAADVVLWMASWFLPIPVCGVLFALLLFPNGELPSARWRVVAWATIGSIVVLTTAYLLGAPLEQFDDRIKSPFGNVLPIETLAGLATLGNLLWTAAIMGTGASVVARFRSSPPDQRQQLKWFAYAVTIAVLISLAQLALAAILSRTPDLPRFAPALTVLTALTPPSVLLIPIAAAIAILRYRLYDIDLLIKRTLVYGALSATLGVIYLVTVLMSQQMLRGFTGGSDIAVAGSTLLVVALFQPIRTRVQAIVDRRFYRARYDAARTIDAFSVRLRREVDLDSVRADLIAVVQETVHPAHASVWLRRPR